MSLKKHVLFCFKGHGEYAADTLEDECPACIDNQPPNFNKGDRVYWTFDPRTCLADDKEASTSGPGTIAEVANDGVVLALDSGYGAEVLICEIDMLPAGGLADLLTRAKAIDELECAFREELRSCDEITLAEEYLNLLGEKPEETNERSERIDACEAAYREDLRACDAATLRDEFISRLDRDPGPIIPG